MNGKICEGLRGWLSSAALRLVSGVVEGEEVEEELRLMNQVGMMVEEQGRLRESEVLKRRVLEGCERVMGIDHPNTLTSVNNLGSLLRQQGKLEEAETLFRHALEGRKRVLGVDHPDTLRSVKKLRGLLNKKEKEELRRRQRLPRALSVSG